MSSPSSSRSHPQTRSVARRGEPPLLATSSVALHRVRRLEHSFFVAPVQPVQSTIHRRTAGGASGVSIPERHMLIQRSIGMLLNQLLERVQVRGRKGTRIVTTSPRRILLMVAVLVTPTVQRWNRNAKQRRHLAPRLAPLQRSERNLAQLLSVNLHHSSLAAITSSETRFNNWLHDSVSQFPKSEK